MESANHIYQKPELKPRLYCQGHALDDVILGSFNYHKLYFCGPITTIQQKMSAITVTVEDGELWKQFSDLENEMIVMKNGRSLFPLLNYYVSGLMPEWHYTAKLHIEAVDDRRYRFDRGNWTNGLRADSIPETRQLYHPDGAKTGAELMKFPIQFKMAKLTNNMKSDEPMHIPVNTMRKYRPVLTLIRVSVNPLTGKTDNLCQQEFRIPYTEFIAVTAYQNKNIIALKTANNKYAKRFRETSRKRKGTKTPEDPETATKSTEPAPKRLPLIETTQQQSVAQLEYYNDYNQIYNGSNQTYYDWPTSYEVQQSAYYPQQEHNEYWNCY